MSELSSGIEDAIRITREERRRRGGNAQKPPKPQPGTSGGAVTPAKKEKETADT